MIPRAYFLIRTTGTAPSEITVPGTLGDSDEAAVGTGNSTKAAEVVPCTCSRHTSRQICISKQFDCLCFSESHEQSINVILDGSLLQQISKLITSEPYFSIYVYHSSRHLPEVCRPDISGLNTVRRSCSTVAYKAHLLPYVATYPLFRA